MPRVKRELKNVWYDTAASPLLYPTGKIFRIALECIDHQKILYGSDYPLLIYPRQQQEPDFRPFIAEINDLGLTPAVYDDIMGNNVAQLFGLLEDTESTKMAGEKNKSTQVSPAAPKAKVVKISGSMAISLVAEAWPQTRPVFEQFGLPWQDKPVPFWEPIAQAAAARGWGPQGSTATAGGVECFHFGGNDQPLGDT